MTDAAYSAQLADAVQDLPLLLARTAAWLDASANWPPIRCAGTRR
ncbi:hypothetical protein [Streptomyces sp. NPDC003247]